MITRNRVRLPVEVPQVIMCPKGAAAFDFGPLSTVLTYDVRDPFAVTLTITSAGVDWVLARNLLADGVNAGAGEGDVYVCPDIHGEPVVWVALFGANSTLILGFPRGEVEHALDLMEGMVPEGSESERIDWARELALLAGER